MKLNQHQVAVQPDNVRCPFCDSGLVWTEAEVDAIVSLAQRLDLSAAKVIKQALRVYQLHVLGEPDLGKLAVQPDPPPCRKCNGVSVHARYCELNPSPGFHSPVQEPDGTVFYPGIVDQKTLSACLGTAEQVIRGPITPDRVARFQRAKAKLIAQVKAHPLSFDEWNARDHPTPPLASDREEAEAIVNEYFAQGETTELPLRVKWLTAAIIAYGERVREADAALAEDPANISLIGGSTGDAYGTSKRIAAAIRSAGKSGEALG